jgi:hypothetical protein
MDQEPDDPEDRAGASRTVGERVEGLAAFGRVAGDARELAVDAIEHE